MVVDQIRIQMWDAEQTVLLFEAFLPVYYRFMNPTNIVTHIEFSPDTPNVFKYSDNVNLTFNYTNNQKDGVRIWARPFSGANLSQLPRRMARLYILRVRAAVRVLLD